MEAATDFVDNHKETEQEDQQSSPVAEQSREELIAEVTEALDNLFDPTALVNNSYLINRVSNENFEIPIKTIYLERSVKSKTMDREIIDRALENATNITVNKKGDIITSVMPKNNETKRRIVVRNITKEKLGDFKRFVYSLDTYKEGALAWNFNYQLSMVNIICKDEELAAHVLELLTNNKFEDRTLECSIENENLYISALEVQKKKFRSFQNPMNQMYNYNAGMYNPYQMYAMYGGQANNFYMQNYYPQMNQQFGAPQMAPYMQPMFNPNPHSAPNMNKRSYNNQNYKNGGDKKFYSKKGKQPRDKNYKFNNSKASTKSSSSIVVNENDFPPL